MQRGSGTRKYLSGDPGIDSIKDQGEESVVMRRLTEILAREKLTDIREAAKLSPQKVARILYRIADKIENDYHDRILKPS